MRNKHKVKNTFPPLSFFQASPSFLHFSHHYLPPLPRAGKRNRECRLWSVHNRSSLTLPPRHAVPLFQRRVAPTGGFTNCSSMGPSCRAQSFRNRLLQHWSPMGCKSYQKACCSPDSSLGTARSLFWHGLPMGCSVDLCSTVVLHGLLDDNLHHQWPSPWAADGHLESPWSLPLIAGGQLPHHSLHQRLQGNL